jgi:hypothetical protein
LASRVALTEATASQLVTASGSLSTRVTAAEATSSAYVTASGSLSTRTTNSENYITAINAKTGSYATTGSNYFIGTQVITGSVYISSDLVVQGSSSLQNITASAVSIGTNTVILNTSTPILRFGGVSVSDSGSSQGRSGSLFWDSLADHWININPSGSDEGYNSAMIINGPKNTGSLGSESGLTEFYIPVSQGEDHITDSIIFQSGSTNIGIGTSVPTAKLDILASSAGSTANILRLKNTSNDTSTGLRVKWDFQSVEGAYLDVTTNSGGSKTMTVYLSAANATPVEVFNLAGSNKAATFAGSVTIAGTNDGAGTLYVSASASTNAARLRNNDASYGTLDVLNSNASGFGLYAVANKHYFSGNVGIGTSSPDRALVIQGSGESWIRSTTTATSTQSWLFGQDGARKGFEVYDATTSLTRFFIAPSTGNVGIGTTNPSDILDVQKNQNATTNFYFRNTDTTNASSRAYLNVIAGSTTLTLAALNSGDVYIAGTSGKSMYFQQNIGGTVNMLINSSGQVGIGTTGPGKRLELSEDNSSTTTTTGLRITNWSGTTDTRAGITFQNYDNVGAAIWSRRTGSTAGNLIFATNSGAGVTAETAVVERMRIDNTGNVGIGTSSPGSLLTVSGGTINGFTFAVTTNSTFAFTGTAYRTAVISHSGGDGNGLQFGYDATAGTGIIAASTNSAGAGLDFYTYNGSSWGGRMRITKDGAVGIGITSPNYRLQVNSSGVNSYMQFTSTTTGTTSSDGFIVGTGDAGDAIVLNRESTNVLFYTNNTERTRIMSGGAIGYGQSANGTPLRATLVKRGTTSITFSMSLNTIGAWRPGFATIRVSGGQNGLQEYWAAWFIYRITGYFGSGTSIGLLSSGGDTGSVSISSSSDQNSPQAFSITLTDSGTTTDTMIADLDVAYHEGIISLT